jgi:hypothetical protein
MPRLRGLGFRNSGARKSAHTPASLSLTGVYRPTGLGPSTNHRSLITVLRSPLSTFLAMTALSAFLQLARLKTTKTQPMKISAAPVSPIKSRWIWRKKIPVKRMMKSG